MLVSVYCAVAAVVIVTVATLFIVAPRGVIIIWFPTNLALTTVLSLTETTTFPFPLYVYVVDTGASP